MPLYICSLPNSGEPGAPRECIADDPKIIEAFAKREDRPGRGVYDCVSPLKPGARRRSLETVAEIVALHVDIDSKNILEDLATADQRLAGLPLRPTEVRNSGHGRHVVFALKEPIDASEVAEVARATAALKQLTSHLCGDMAVAHHAALLRRPGTHNSKGGEWTECEYVLLTDARYDLGDIEDWLGDAGDRTLFTRRAAGNGRDKSAPAAGEHKPPIDVEARLAAMKFGGPGDSSVHMTQLSVTASLLRSGVALEETTCIVLEATRAAVAGDPSWNWRREELKILRMGCDFVFKNPELASLLPDDWQAPFAAALAAGRRPDVGLNRVFYFRAWKNTKAGVETEEPAGTSDASDSPAGWHLYDSTKPEPPRWLIKGLLPETGLGIIPGQWGSYKTTTALEMALAVMTNQPFAGHYRIKRAGAVIYFAAEGAGTLQSRLAAIARQRGAPEKLPFAWRGDCPLLTARDAGPAIAAHCDAAAAYFKRVYGVPTVLILIDTYSVAAGFTASGDDSDTAATQKTFNALRFVHKHTGAAVAVVDHFGKMMESGTRGSSNKESNADAVLATLADKELNGTISNTRLAVRKQRDGRSGFEIPFTPQVVELGLDEDGDPITAVVLDWGAPRVPAHQARKSKDLVLLCTVLAETVTKKGFPFLPEPGGPMVQACHSDDLRDAFLARRKKRRNAAANSSAPRVSYHRALASAVERGLMGTRSNDCQCLVWKKG
jgi:AAA domain